MRKSLVTVGLILFIINQLRAKALAHKKNVNPQVALMLQRFRSELKPLSFKKSNQSCALNDYLQFYDLNKVGTQHHIGYLHDLNNGSNEHIFTHILKPQAPKGTFVLLHGYFVHSAIQKYIIQDLLNQNYTVVTFDLPGHGLSTGPRAKIDDFSDYARVIDMLTQNLSEEVTGPLYIMAHSTGAAGVIEYISTHSHPYKKIVLVAPLVHSSFWRLSQFGVKICQRYLSEVPRIIRSGTGDPSFLEFLNTDPLQYKATPLSWLKSLFRWNRYTVPFWRPSNQDVLILQGTKDIVLEWRYNLRFLKQLFPKSQIIQIKGGCHDLFWETPTIRKELFQFIENYLKD